MVRCANRLGIFLLVCLVHIDRAIGFNLTVKTENGYVKGQEETGAYNVTYFAFKGIPFAEPPIGKLRFKDPVPASSWEGVKETTEYAEQCTSLYLTTTMGQEDCLYLNVFVPYTQNKAEDLSLPVMVWIHGGGFFTGAASYYDPSYLLAKPVIIVSITYRLSVFGFLSTLDENARGNAALKDQNLALKWVHDNIQYFGGNSSRITIFGQSAGGASVDFHVISPKSSGLFSQAISQSGSALDQWAIQTDPLDLTLSLAKAFNITSTNTSEIVETLQEVDYATLNLVASSIGSWFPIIEVESEEAFLSRSPYDIWESGDFNRVPFMVGYANEDGTVGQVLISSSVEDPVNIIPPSLNLDMDSEEAKEVVELITQRYFPNYSYDNLTNDIVFFTQAYFVRGIRKTVEEYLKFSSPLYFYVFTYATKADYYGGMFGGAGHGDDTLYLFPIALIYEELAEADIPIKDRMVTMWTNFAIYGNPTPEEDELLENILWPEAKADIESEDDVRYLEIGESLIPGKNVDQEDYLFWKDIFEKYAVPPLRTY